LTMVTQSFSTQMSDEERLAVINAARVQMDKLYTDLGRFSNQNALLSLQRAGEGNEISLIKKMYGL
jgi:hypothetical protein